MDISFFSNDYTVCRMEKADVADIYLLCSKNGLYYQYCPPSGFRTYGLAG